MIKYKYLLKSGLLNFFVYSTVKYQVCSCLIPSRENILLFLEIKNELQEDQEDQKRHQSISTRKKPLSKKYCINESIMKTTF